MLRACVFAVCGFSALAFCALAQAADPPRQALPKFETAGKLVRLYFSRQENYQPGDMITREQATEVFGHLKKLRWDVRDQDKILKDCFSEKDFLPATLRSRNGQEFMRQVAALPSGYDRLDRLSQLSRGRRMVEDLATDKDGYKLIEYLADTKGGNNLGKMLEGAPRGQDFNQPTGKVYTEDDLLRRLEEAYQAELRGKSPAKGGKQVADQSRPARGHSL